VDLTKLANMKVSCLENFGDMFGRLIKSLLSPR